MTVIPDTRADTRRLVREVATRVLSPRQLDVWRLHTAGRNHAQIALILNISERSSRTHLARATVKLLAALETELGPRG